MRENFFGFMEHEVLKSRPLDQGLSQLNPFQSSVSCYLNVGRTVQHVQITIYEKTLVQHTVFTIRILIAAATRFAVYWRDVQAAQSSI